MVLVVFFIKKKDGSLQFVQDYQALNAMTIKNRYLIPLINNLINHLKGAQFLTKLNVWWGFNNVCIREGSILDQPGVLRAIGDVFWTHILQQHSRP